MRVISGFAKGRKLYTPGKLDIRPTSDKVKESLFNVLGNGLVDSTLLDLCTGSGAIGIEALSRGASEVVFVDLSREAIALAEKNLLLCGFASSDYPKVAFISMSGLKAIERFAADGKSFDFIFIDTPYHGEILDTILGAVELYPSILAEGGKFIVEHYSKRDLPKALGSIVLYRSNRYGDTSLSYYLNNS